MQNDQGSAGTMSVGLHFHVWKSYMTSLHHILSPYMTSSVCLPERSQDCTSPPFEAAEPTPASNDFDVRHSSVFSSHPRSSKSSKISWVWPRMGHPATSCHILPPWPSDFRCHSLFLNPSGQLTSADSSGGGRKLCCLQEMSRCPRISTACCSHLTCDRLDTMG